jgi:hypothetical protein
VMRGRRNVVGAPAAIAAAIVSLFAAGARADDTPACLGAYEQAQRYKSDSRLRAARDALIVCARDTCPVAIARECDGWRTEVEQSLPTVVVEARGPSGQDLVEVRVRVDGEVIAERLDGRPLAVDPGAHTFRYELHGGAGVAPPIEERLVVRAGEKNRRLVARFEEAATQAAGPERPTPVAVWVLGGVGVVGLGAFGYFALRGNGIRGDLDECKPTCSSAEVDRLTTHYALADVSLGVAAVSLGAALVVFLTRPEVAAPAAPRAALRITPARGGAGLSLAGAL